METVVELHDSVISAVRVGGGTLILDLNPAIVHESEGRPGVSPGRVLTQHIQVELRGTVLSQELLAPCRIADGRFEILGTVFDGMLPFPVQAAGPVGGTVSTDSGICVQLTARSIAVHPIGPSAYLESFAGVTS